MENKKFEQFIDQAKKTNLSAEERSSIKTSVLNFIKENPVRPNVLPRLVNQNNANASFWSTVFLTKLNFVSTMAILLFLSILVSGGAAIGAEQSLPGEVLYPVKLSVNEQVRGWFSVSEEAKANWEVERTWRRLEEAEALASSGNLDAAARRTIIANFEAQSERVKDRIEKFRAKENFNAAVDVGSNFETALMAHDRILSTLVEAELDSQGQIEPIVVKVRSQARAAKKERKKNEDSMSSQVYVGIEAAAEGKLKAAENKIEEVRRFFASINAEVDAEASAEAEAKLKLAEASVAAGKVKLEAKAYGDAFVLFQKAISISQQAKLIVMARQELNLDVDIDGEDNEGSGSNEEINGDVNLKTEDGSTQVKGHLKANLGL